MCKKLCATPKSTEVKKHKINRPTLSKITQYGGAKINISGIVVRVPKTAVHLPTNN
jgi:ribosomal protein L18E